MIGATIQTIGGRLQEPEVGAEMMIKRRGPEFETLADHGDCEAQHCSRVAKYVAKWPFVVKRACSAHMVAVDGKPWDEAQPNFGTPIRPR